MKLKLPLLTIFSFLCTFALAQPVVQRSTASTTVQDARLSAQLNFILPRFSDTTQASASIGVDSCGAIIFTYTGNKIWKRSCNPKRWQEITVGGVGSGTVTVVTGSNVNGFTWTITNPTTTPNLTLSYTEPTITDWKLLGNASTVAGTNFVGTTDNIGLMFKTNSVQSGYIDLVNKSTSFGKGTLLVNAALYNSAFGLNALTATTSGVRNTGMGTDVLVSNTTGQRNAAFGDSSLYGNTTGSMNTAIGSRSGNLSATLSNTIAIGANARVGISSAASYGDTTLNIYHGFGTAYPTARVDIRGATIGTGFRMKDGSEAASYIMVSDANGFGTWQSLGSISGKVSSVSGTLNRITVANGTTAAVVDISASYVGQTSITTLGTVTTGTWQATSVKIPYGGTGLTSFSAGSMMYYVSGTSMTLLAIGTSGQLLRSTGSAPQWFTPTYISDTSGKWITSVYRKTASDSVFYVKGGTATFAFKDSLGVYSYAFTNGGGFTGTVTNSTTAATLALATNFNGIAYSTSGTGLSSTTIGVGLTLDAPSKTLSWDGLNASINSSGVFITERSINFVEGAGIDLTIGDDPGNGKIDVTITATGGGSGGGTNTNIGSGFRWAIPNTNQIKTFFASSFFTLDSATNSNALTISLTNAAGGTVFANNTTSSATPAFTIAPVLGIAGTSQGSIGLSGATSGVITIKGVAAAGTFNFNLPITAGTSGQALVSGGGGSTAMTWATLTSGTVTSVALSVPSLLTVSGSPITSSGTFAVTWNGVTTGGIAIGSGTNTMSNLAIGANTYILQSNGTTAVWVDYGSDKNPGKFWNVLGNGQVNPATYFLGTTDSSSLRFRTNNVERLVLDSFGRFGFNLGGATPSHYFEIAGTVNMTGMGTAVSDTTTYKPLVRNTSNGDVFPMTYWPSGGSGTVTSVSVVTANGFAGTVATATSTPAITLTTSVTSGQVIFSSSSALTGSTSLTYSSPQLTIGLAGTSTGILGLTGSTSGTISIKGAAAAGTYNFILPITVGTAGQVLTSQGGGSTAMTWTTLGGGTGTVTDFIFTDGSGFDGTVATSTSTPTLSLTTTVADTRVVISSSGAVAGSANLTFVSPTLTVGVAGSATGVLALTGATSGTISVKGVAAAGTYNFNLPITAGISGYLLTSGGGSSTAMTWTDPNATMWLLLGNSGTTAGTNFLGTTDAIDVVLKRNSVEGLRLESAITSIPTGVDFVMRKSSANNLKFSTSVSSSGQSIFDVTPETGTNVQLIQRITSLGTSNAGLQVITSSSTSGSNIYLKGFQSGGGYNSLTVSQSLNQINFLAGFNSATGIKQPIMTFKNQDFVSGFGNAEGKILQIGDSINGSADARAGRILAFGQLLLKTTDTLPYQAPLRFQTGGTGLLITPQDGSMEYNGTHLYFTISSTRYQLDQQGGGGGSVTDVSNSDGTLTISPTTGSVVASLALGHSNTFTANQHFTTTVTTGTGSSAGMNVLANSLTTGNGVDISSSSVTTGNILKVTSTSTAANAFSLASFVSSGANGTATRTATGLTISVTNTGTTSTNQGLVVTASGATTNTAISATGAVNVTGNTKSTSYSTTVQALSDGATITWDETAGAIGTVTLGGNRTLSITNSITGSYITLFVTQDGTGSRTLALPAGSKVIGGGSGAITLTTTAGATDVLTGYYNGTAWYWNYGKNYN